METSKNLHKLLEIADLAGMVEDLMNPTTMSTLSPASWSGMRITLRNIKESLLSAHDKLASDLVGRSKDQAASRTDMAASSHASSTSSLTKGIEFVREEQNSKNQSNASALLSAATGDKKSELRGAIEKRLNG